VQFKRRQADGSWLLLKPVERLTIQEAVAKGWTVSANNKPKGPWLKTPKNMLFARVITNGQKFHCPDLFNGLLVYDADELGGDPPAVTTPPAGEVIDASYTVNGHRVDQNAPPPPAQADPTPPASPPETAGPLSETEYQELVALARQHKRTQGEVIAVCRALGIPVLQKVTREKLGWVRHALTTGLVRTEQADRILALAKDLNLDWEKFRGKLQVKFQVGAVQHLLPAQADQIEASLKEAQAKARETASA
jgi:hypothetical protein